MKRWFLPCPALQVQGIFHKALKSNARQPLILDIGMNAVSEGHGVSLLPQEPAIAKVIKCYAAPSLP